MSTENSNTTKNHCVQRPGNENTSPKKMNSAVPETGKENPAPKRRRLTYPTSVYIAYFSQKIKTGYPFYENHDRNRKILGVFYSEDEAISCAEEYVSSELDNDEEDYFDDDDDDDDNETSCVCRRRNLDTDEDVYDKVWVECHDVEDASSD